MVLGKRRAQEDSDDDVPHEIIDLTFSSSPAPQPNPEGESSKPYLAVEYGSGDEDQVSK